MTFQQAAHAQELAGRDGGRDLCYWDMRLPLGAAPQVEAHAGLLHRQTQRGTSGRATVSPPPPCTNFMGWASSPI